MRSMHEVTLKRRQRPTTKSTATNKFPSWAAAGKRYLRDLIANTSRPTAMLRIQNPSADQRHAVL